MYPNELYKATYLVQQWGVPCSVGRKKLGFKMETGTHVRVSECGSVNNFDITKPFTLN
jgi:hypothetical protein